jgi:ABC-type methionine transport system permease subunit
MTHADLARFHSDSANWKLGIFYFCRSDPRILVPKRILGLGWTLNFGRPTAVPFFLFLVALIPCGAALARSLGAGSETSFIVKILIVVGIIAFCHRLTRRPSAIPEPGPNSENRDAESPPP